jgi:hypothetical protein
MATDTLHLNLRAAAALVAAALAALPVPAAAYDRVATAGGSGRGCALRLPARLPDRQIAVPILMYHRINVVTPATPAESRPLSVHPADFARQMGWLKRHRYRTITQRELFEALMCGRPLGPRPIMITFDDGYRDVFFKASPVLMRLGMRATAYVVSGRISGRDPSFLTWPAPARARATRNRDRLAYGRAPRHDEPVGRGDARGSDQLTACARA